MKIRESAIIVTTVSIGLFASSIVFGQTWQGPTAAPPAGNVPAPLNVGTTAQTKQGVLTVTNLTAINDVKGVRLCIGEECRNSWPQGGTNQWTTSGSNIYYTVGKVGIGVTNPNSALHVKTASGNAEIDLQSASSPHWGIYQDDTTDELRFWNGGTNRVVFTAAGNVGIGTSTTPTHALEVASSFRVGNANSWFQVLTGGNTRLSLGDGAAHEAGFIAGGHNTAGQNTITIAGCNDAGSCPSYTTFQENGNVGIGAVIPRNKLHVAGGLNKGNIQLDNQGSIVWGLSDGNFLDGGLRLNADDSFQIRSGPGGTIFKNSGNNEVARITNGGNVGIGTVNPPSVKLEVAGQIKITGGSPAAGKVLTSDAGGLASWQVPTGGGLTQTTADTLYVKKAGDTMTGNLTLSNSDLKMTSTKAIRVDNTEGESILNIGNWGGNGGTQLPVTLAIVGEGSKITTPEFCFGSDCRTSWATMNLGANLRYLSVLPPTIAVVNEPSFTSVRIGAPFTATSANTGLNVNGSNLAISASANGIGINASATLDRYGIGVNGYANGEDGIGVRGRGKKGVSGSTDRSGGSAFNGVAEISDAYAGVFTGGKGVVIQKGSQGLANLIIKNGGISMFSADENVDAGTIEASKFCIGNGTNCITSWPGVVTTGTDNTANGLDALRFNTTGSVNTAIGADSLYSNTMGAANTAIGASSLYSNTTGNNNTADGRRSLFFNTTGTDNTADGNDALTGNTTGSNNTALGAHANVASGALLNATAIGAEAIVDASNKVRIGNDAVTVIGGKVGWSNLSDVRLKKDIQGSDLGLDFINQLRPVSFRMKDGNDALDYGFIAQEVEAALGDRKTNIVLTDSTKEKMKSMRYNDLIAPLVKAVQEQQKEIEVLKLEVEKLRSSF